MLTDNKFWDDLAPNTPTTLPTATSTNTATSTTTGTSTSTPTRTATRTFTATYTPTRTRTRTATATDTPPVGCSFATVLTIIPVADTYKDSLNPNTNYGSAPGLLVGLQGWASQFGVTSSLLRFTLPPIPAGTILLRAQLLARISDDGGSPVNALVTVLRIGQTWSESGVTWNNSPAAEDAVASGIARGQGTDTVWDVSQLIRDWYAGSVPNYGLMLTGNGRYRAFASRHGAAPPRLLLTYVSALPCTATPTSVPTATSTATVTPVVTADLVADALEVTQSVQDLNNSIALVAGKRTFVRFHVHSNAGNYLTYADLFVTNSLGASMRLAPINSGGQITVRPSPDRAVLDQAFLFELPVDFIFGTTTINAEVNPVTSARVHDPVEVTYANNTKSTTVTFQPGSPIAVMVYRLGYNVGSTHFWPPASDVDAMMDWLLRAYPISGYTYWERTSDWGTAVALGGELINPNCATVDAFLAGQKLWDMVVNPSIPLASRYYAMVADNAGFMRGCAVGVVASGPTGTRDWGWDFDGTYGDWYGGHELGHTYGRGHANFCGAEFGPSYPYPDGRISADLTGNGAVYGFDAGTRAIYGPAWHDVMTYCDNEWTGRFTYEGLMNTFQPAPAVTADRRTLDQTDRLLVVGTLDATTGQVSLQPLFIIPNAGDVKERVPGSYAITLRDGAGAVLARYPFTPQQVDGGPTAPAASSGRSVTGLLINELVPYVAGTNRVEIEGAGGAVLGSVSAGAGAPVVTLTAPNGGEVLSGSTITVTWTASDPDGDPLSFIVQYTPDNGANWFTVAQDQTGRSAVVDAANVPAGNQARFRVWASDGIHTASDASDGTFTVPNRIPTVHITRPTGMTAVAAGQTLDLEAVAYDVDTGSMADSQVLWSSNLDGALGQGAGLRVASLSQGFHTITVRADDGVGGVATDTVQVVVVSDPSQLPPPLPGLVAGPETILLEPALGMATARLSIDSQDPGQTLTWQALAGAPWLYLSATAGTTPDQVTLSLDGAGLTRGTYTTTITLTSPDVDGSTVVRVKGVIGARLYLPVILRP